MTRTNTQMRGYNCNNILCDTRMCHVVIKYETGHEIYHFAVRDVKIERKNIY